MLIALIHYHSLFRSGLRLLLADLPAGDEVALEFIEAASLDEVTPDTAGLPVDIVIFDVMPRPWDRPDPVGTMALLRQRFGDTPLAVVVSGDERPSTVRDAIAHGAAGYIPSASTPAVLISALRLMLAGGTYVPPHTLQIQHGGGHGAGIGSSTPGAQPARIEIEEGGRNVQGSVWLSDRQREVLHRAMKGRSNREIALDMGISEGTVKQHLSAAYRTLGVSNRTEAVFAASELRLWQQPRREGEAGRGGASRPSPRPSPVAVPGPSPRPSAHSGNGVKGTNGTNGAHRPRSALQASQPSPPDDVNDL